MLARALLPVLAGLSAAPLAGQLHTKPVLDLAAARLIAQGANAAADAATATVVIAVVDDGGHLLLLARRDDTQVASGEVAIAKARTAAIFRRPSRDFEQQIAAGRLASLVLPGAAPLQGGVPLVCAGRCVGAIGVSGNSPAQDEAIALAGAAASARLGCLRGGQAPPHAVAPQAVPTRIEKLGAGLDAIVASDAVVEQVATGFTFTEGPLWREDALWFSDPNENTIYAWSEKAGVRGVKTRSGYQGDDVLRYRQPGSNGLALDAAGRLLVCEHGNRRVSRLEPDGTTTVLADRYQGRRLNSPNDLWCASDGSVYFTDPPFGLPAFGADPARELPFCGVFRWRDGVLTLLVDDLAGPNGVALSPDERTLYIGNWDVAQKVVRAYPLAADGSVGKPKTLLDLTSETGDTAIDGIEVDAAGNVYVCGPRGVWIVNAMGTRLGRIDASPEEPHNLAWGDDGRTLYVAAQTGIYRVRTKVGAVRRS